MPSTRILTALALLLAVFFHEQAHEKKFNQRTPWGVGKKRGVENLTNDSPPKKGFWTPLSYGTFSTLVRFPPLIHFAPPPISRNKSSMLNHSIFSGVSERGRSKRGHSQKHANERKRAQMSAKQRKRKSAKERKRPLLRKNCKQPGLKQPARFQVCITVSEQRKS